MNPAILSIRDFDSTPDSAPRSGIRRFPAFDKPRLRIPSLDLVAGRCYAVIGKSGAGKTVLNSFLLGFPASRLGGGVRVGKMEWWGNRVSLDGSDFRRQSRLLVKWRDVRKTGTLLYLPQMLPDGRGYQMSVRAYLGQVLPALRRQSRGEDGKDENPFAGFPEELSRVLDEPVTNLSGGERRRVELWARLHVLGSLPEDRLALLVLDEPTTGLDVPDERRYLTDLRREMEKRRNLAVLVTTHALYFLDDALPDGSGVPLFDRVFLVHKDEVSGKTDRGVPSCRVTPDADSRRLCKAVMERSPGKSVEDAMEDFVEWQARLDDGTFSTEIENRYFREDAE